MQLSKNCKSCVIDDFNYDNNNKITWSENDYSKAEEYQKTGTEFDTLKETEIMSGSSP